MWVKVDDNFISHPKVQQAAEALGEFGLGRVLACWLTGASYAQRHQTDGFIPIRVARRVDDPVINAVIDAVIDAGLWERTPGGYRIHDWRDFNPDPEKVKARRKRQLQRQQEWLARRLDAHGEKPQQIGAHQPRDASITPSITASITPSLTPSTTPSLTHAPRARGTRSHTHKEEERERGEREAAHAAPHPSPEQAFADCWNTETSLPIARCRELTPRRKTAIRARLKERPLEEWRAICQRINASDFCRGQNDRGWVATIDWALQPDTATKVLEGKYDNRARADARTTKRATDEAELAAWAKGGSA